MNYLERRVTILENVSQPNPEKTFLLMPDSLQSERDAAEREVEQNGGTIIRVRFVAPGEE